jgi:hypothetical protein
MLGEIECSLVTRSPRIGAVPRRPRRARLGVLASVCGLPLGFIVFHLGLRSAGGAGLSPTVHNFRTGPGAGSIKQRWRCSDGTVAGHAQSAAPTAISRKIAMNGRREHRMTGVVGDFRAARDS